MAPPNPPPAPQDHSITADDISASTSVAIGHGASANTTINNTTIHNTTVVKRTPAQERAERNRRDMLQLVKDTWVKGLLEKSLHAEVMLRLGLEERPGAVARPWDVQVQMPHQPNRPLPPGTSIMQVFDEMQGELLILGEPGAGKTTTLLELARDTIARAEQDLTQPIPVVFNLSSWVDPNQPLAQWLEAELRAKYHVPQPLAAQWLKQGELLLLLDGLDEVKTERRAACAQAINAFRQNYGLTLPLVVCCRVADYELLATPLQLRGAVVLQPLTDEQIDHYLERAGPELAAVRATWRQDAALQELARQPLMLSIMTLAYQGASPELLADEQATSVDARRKHLFDAYIRQMFVRVGRSKNEAYTLEQTTRYLTWLAQRMIENGQTIFYVERMRREKILLQRQQLAISLLFSVIGGLLGWFSYSTARGWLFGLWMIVLSAMLGLSVANTSFTETVEMLNWLWEKFVKRLPFLPSSWLAALRAGLDSILSPNRSVAFMLKMALIMGVSGGAISALITNITKRLLEGLVLSTASGWELGLLFGLLFGGGEVLNYCASYLVLFSTGCIPLNYFHFLNNAADHIFLRKVGGGYLFIHRWFMEHFAALAPWPDYNKLGAAYYKLERYEEALVSLKRAIELNPNDAYSYSDQGRVYFDLDRYNEALVAYQKAIEINPKEASFYYNQGRILSKTKLYDEALAAYQCAIELDPHNAHVHDSQGDVYRLLRRYDEAIMAYQSAITLDSKLAYPHNGQGLAYRNLQFYQEAIIAYQHAIELDPKSVYPYNNLGDMYVLQGRLEQGFEAYQKAADLKPEDGMCQASLVGVLMRLGRTAEAKEQIQFTRPLMEKETTYQRACFEAICGNTEAALPLLENALKSAPPSLIDWAAQDPDFESLRTDPRYRALVGLE